VRIGNGDVLNVRKRCLRACERIESRMVVEWSDLGPLLDVRKEPVLDHGGVDHEVAEVHDPVPDGVSRDKILDSGRSPLLVDERELQARRAGVDDENGA
jgi:hypothetical protein